MVPLKICLRLLMVVVIFLCRSKNHTIQDIMSYCELRSRVISRLSDGELYNLSHCNHAFKKALSKELCGRAKGMIFDTMSDLRASFQSGQQHQLLDDFEVYVQLFIIDETTGTQGAVYAILSAMYRPLRVKPDYSLYDYERVIMVNNAKEFIMSNCDNMHDADEFELNQKYHLTLFIENGEAVNDLYDEWTIIRNKFQLVHRRFIYTKLVNVWNDMLMVVKKDIFKVIINAQHNNTMDIQFYYNEPWILLLKYISRCSEWFKRKIFSDICRFNRLSSDLIQSAKNKFDFRFASNADLRMPEIGDDLVTLMQNMAHKSAKKIVATLLDANDHGAPYVAEVDVYNFFDAHHFLIVLRREIYVEIGTTEDINASLQMALDFELLKMHKLDAVYRDLTEYYEEEEQNNTNTSSGTYTTPDRNACMLCLCWAGFSCFIFCVLAVVWIGVWFTRD